MILWTVTHLDFRFPKSANHHSARRVPLDVCFQKSPSMHEQGTTNEKLDTDIHVATATKEKLVDNNFLTKKTPAPELNDPSIGHFLLLGDVLTEVEILNIQFQAHWSNAANLKSTQMRKRFYHR
ncbi:hypothetical protein CDAR_461151 [Caerostris darwini]|uniref:Uncharacterized protein n=1 Tax=Caerostris darwini TaxID=1538125 RepID=A0AAV4SCN4_9ARAC|nr:hypothetical protein CDAR_461151 [Caerostris darwini]